MLISFLFYFLFCDVVLVILLVFFLDILQVFFLFVFFLFEALIAVTECLGGNRTDRVARNLTDSLLDSSIVCVNFVKVSFVSHLDFVFF